ncbi:uncharacterized protein Pyn_03318 [Prunus yedoensis var. nudiflora]|uniref:Hemimethylated DNA-binding domain-containing protein n=1 Tax=Prunus yedoensis var. nudiflora TaxID=2094558 RepID=A0A314Z8X9_PRUYE|nr:uncharacterized protein Pyn_03318 [Prunus yedoensis var. nudiflora]
MDGNCTQVENLSRGSDQPVYQVLVDVHADPNLLVAYVSEENLVAPDEPDFVSRSLPFSCFLLFLNVELGYYSGTCEIPPANWVCLVVNLVQDQLVCNRNASQFNSSHVGIIVSVEFCKSGAILGYLLQKL